MDILHLFAGSRRVASIRTDGNNQFYHGNHLGSASVITGQDGDWRERIEYYPFGTYLWDEKNPNYPNFQEVNYTFTDQEDDDELGLYNYGARLYDPLLGRFISPDRLVQAPENPQSLNRYSYCLNNPLIYTDPSGEFWELIVAVIVGSFMGAYQANKAGENPWKGAMLGAIIGATSYMVGNVVGTAVTELLTPVVQTAVNAAAVSAAPHVGTMAGGFAGGATAGALNASAYGGNVWQAALYGGLMSAVAAGTSSIIGDVQIFGSSEKNWAANIANRLTKNFLIGSTYGAAYAGITGENIFKGAAYGGLAWAGGEMVNMAIGHGFGFIASGFKGPEFKEGAFVYGVKWVGGIFPFSVGGVVIGNPGELRSENPVGAGFQGTKFEHEVSHATGGQSYMGPTYILGHFLTQGVGGIIGIFTGVGFKTGTHRYGLLERWLIELPNYE